MIVVVFVLPDSTNSSENIYTMMNPIDPGGNRPTVRLREVVMVTSCPCSSVSPCVAMAACSDCVSLQFPMGPGPGGPMGGMGSMEPHHMNGSLGRCQRHGNGSLSGCQRHGNRSCRREQCQSALWWSAVRTCLSSGQGDEGTDVNWIRQVHFISKGDEI